MEYIEFGEIVNTHALKGEVKIYSYTDNEKNILSLKKVYVCGKEYTVQSSRFQKGMFTMKFEQVNSIDEAQALVGNVVMRKVDASEQKAKDEFFIKDLEGCAVYKTDGSFLGTLTQVVITGANDVYEIKMQDEKLVYIPAIRRVVKNIDISAKKIIVDNLEGLIWNLVS